MEHHTLLYRHSQISYYSFGTGAQPVICFHGYGETAESFSFLEKHTGNSFTFISLDLPFHGKTTWNEKSDFTDLHLQQIVRDILDHLGHVSSLSAGQQQPKLVLLGFSLGGRVALSFYQSHPNLVSRIVLLAPDGLKVNFWYWLATQTWVGNRLFAFTMQKPAWFFGLLKLLNKLKLVNPSIFKFVNFYIGNNQARASLYQRWTGLRKLKPDLSCIKSGIRKEKTLVRLLYGKHDRIILSSVGEKFRKGIEDYCEIDVIHSGHQVLHEKHVREILPSLSV